MMVLFKMAIVYAIVTLIVGITSILLAVSKYETACKITFAVFIAMTFIALIVIIVAVLMIPDDIALKVVG